MSYVRVLFGILVWGVSSCVMASSQIKRVVFDIDEFICWKTKQADIAAVKRRFPECIVIDVTLSQETLRKYGSDEGKAITYPHVFAPYMECVFEYVRTKGWLNAFFSSGIAERNEPLIQSYFSQLLGTNEYLKQRSQGQYKVWSKQHLSKKANGQEAKDLKTTLGEGESIDNTILGEDDASYAAKGQEFMVKGRWADNIFGIAVLPYEGATYFDRNTIDHSRVLAMNHTYLILGILDFCSDFLLQDSTLSLRGALQKTLTIALPEDKEELFNKYPEFNDPQTFVFLKRGLEIVRQKHPQAHFYLPKRYEGQDLEKLVNGQAT